MRIFLRSKAIKIIIIIIILLVITFFCLYEYVINPLNETGYRCTTFYNLNHYDLIGLGNMEILENSCFVADCCDHTYMFRVKMDYDQLQIKAKELEEKLQKEIKEKYPNQNIELKVNISKGLFYNEYSIFYY